MSRIVPKSKNLANNSSGNPTDSDLSIQDILKGPIPVYYSGVPKPSSTNNSLHNNASLGSLLSPPLTPMPLYQLEVDLEREKELELQGILQSWSCRRCVECSVCRQHERTGNEKQNKFLKCVQCRLSYHVGCVKKSQGKRDPNEKWICENCFKCKSCGKKVERRSGISTSGISEGDNGLLPISSTMLCLNCFRQRQKGSYCPICQVCYDDNDFETRVSRL